MDFPLSRWCLRLWKNRKWTSKVAAIVTASGAIVFLRRLWRATVQPPRVALHYDSRNKMIVQKLLPKLAALRRGHAPSVLIPTGLLQSAFAEMHAPPAEAIRFSRQVIPLAELDFEQTLDRVKRTACCPKVVPAGEVSVDWLPPSPKDDPSAPICILVPGLTGSSEAGYIRRTAVLLASRGFRVACYNPRGRAGNCLESAFLYSAGYTEDLRRVIRDVIRQQHADVPLVACGFSLGSNYLAKFVGEEGDACLLAGAVSVACPMDLVSMSNNLHHSWKGRMLDLVLVASVQKVRKAIEHVLQSHSSIDLERVKAARTMSEFDDAVIAPMFDLRCVSDYYRESSAGSYLQHIRVPMLFLSAQNDPIAPAVLVRKDNFDGGAGRRSDVFSALPILLAITEEGGHSMVWPEGVFGNGSWAIEVIAEFAEAVTLNK